MKNFLKRYGLMIIPTLWAAFMGFVLVMNIIVHNEDLFVLFIVAGALIISLVLGFIARGKGNKVLAAIAMATAVVDFLLIPQDMLLEKLGPFYTLHLICKILLVVNMILVFRSKKKEVKQVVSNASDNRQVAQMQEQLTQMRTEMERMKAGQTEKVTEPIQTAQAEEAAPSASAEVRPEVVAVPQMPDVEKKLDIQQTRDVAAQSEQMRPEAVAVPQIPDAEKKAVVSARNHENPCFVVNGSKSNTVFAEDGVQHQGKKGSFNASYEEIENFYKLGALYVILYKGKEYQLDSNDQNLLKEAFEFGRQHWEQARKNKPAMRVANDDSEPVYTADTFTMTLQVYATYCVLTAKRNAANLLIMDKFFNGEKRYYYVDLTSVQYRAPGKLTDGFLEFEYPGSRSGKNTSSYSSENSVTFGKQHAPLMEEIYRFIDDRIRQSRNKGQAAPVASADEMLKYKQLLDMGVITQEEFDAKKKQLLGL